MKFIKNYNEDDIMSKILMMYFSFQHGAVGLFLLLADKTILALPMFKGMASILPMNIWGVMLLTSAICFLLASIQENSIQYWSMIIAGLTGVTTFGLLAMANMELSVNQTNTVNYIIIASIDVTISILGGVALWRRKGL